MDADLSPIKSNDVSKHIFDTSTSYRGSPDHVYKTTKSSPNQSPTRCRGNIRDLIKSQSTCNDPISVSPSVDSNNEISVTDLQAQKEDDSQQLDTEKVGHNEKDRTQTDDASRGSSFFA